MHVPPACFQRTAEVNRASLRRSPFSLPPCPPAALPPWSHTINVARQTHRSLTDSACHLSSSAAAFLLPSKASVLNTPRSRPLRGGAAHFAMAAAKPPEKIVICGGGIQSAAIAYYLSLRGVKSTIVERSQVACAASGKAGGFLARGWGSGATRQLHEVSFDLHEQLAKVKSRVKIKQIGSRY